MNGEPIVTSIIFGGINPVCVDALAVKSMGLDYNLFKSISKAAEINKWRLLDSEGCDLTFPNQEVPNLMFQLSKGWR
jgi:hypothetical protein